MALFVCLRERAGRARCQNESSSLAENCKRFHLIEKLPFFYFFIFFEKTVPLFPNFPQCCGTAPVGCSPQSHSSASLPRSSSSRFTCYMAKLSHIATSHWNLSLIRAYQLQIPFRSCPFPNFSSVLQASVFSLDKENLSTTPFPITILHADTL